MSDIDEQVEEELKEEPEVAGETAEERKKRKAKEKAKAKKEKEKEKKKKDKKGGDEEAAEDGAGKKKKGKTSAIKELLRLRMEAEEKARQEAEAEQVRLEALQKQREEEERLAQEKKDAARKKKQDEIEKQKREGTFLTKAQRQALEKRKAILANPNIQLPAAFLEKLAAEEGGSAPTGTGKKVIYGNKKNRKKPGQAASVAAAAPEPAKPEPEKPESAEPVKAEEPAPPPPEEEEEDVADDWENIEEENLKERIIVLKDSPPSTAKPKKAAVVESSSSESEDSDEEEEEEEELTNETRDIIRARLRKRREEAESKRTTDNLRSPIICVLGHVDTGKTKMLDTIRRTNVQEGEAGGITQQIGATRVPAAAIQERCRMVRGFTSESISIPGFLIIDTPGHESFANLRSRGSSLCDFAILVVDIMHGLEPQTIESLQLLLKRKTPFVVALNKIDRLYNYESSPRKDIWQHIKSQPENTRNEFQQRWNQIAAEFSEQGVNVALANKNENYDEYISVVPTSAYCGDGIGNLMAHIVHQSQTRFAEKLAFCEELDCTVMEVRSIQGLGMTIDVILVNGTLHVNDFIILSGSRGPISTQVRDLLMPAPLKEMRVKNEYEHYKEIKGAQGVKILAKELETAVAGLPLFVANRPDEVDLFCEDARHQLESALTSIKKKAVGVHVQASTLGSLEALLEFLKSQSIPYAGVNIGPVHKKDVQKASTMHEHNPEFACILAFDVPVDRETQLFADRENVRIFQANIIYHLEDMFLQYREELRLKRRKENEHLAIFPCILRILPQHIFNARNPIVVGVNVEEGTLRKGTPICAKTEEEIVYLGTVTSIESNHDLQDSARKGEEVSIKIENTTGEAPKLYGRHFTYTDPLISRINRTSIDVCKQYFREDLSKQDWVLVIKLKKMLGIM